MADDPSHPRFRGPAALRRRGAAAVLVGALGACGVAAAAGAPAARVDFMGLRAGRFAVLEATPGGARPAAPAAAPTVPQRPAWSQTGRLAFVCRNFQLCVAGPGRRVRAVTSTRWPGRWTYDTEPAWSPDGRRLAFSSNRAGSYRIFVVAASGGPVRALAGTGGGGEHPSWSPDGKRIVFDRRVGRKTYLYVVRAAGGGRRLLGARTGRASAPSWSPDGRSVAFTVRTPGGSHIAVIGADGHGSRVVTGGKFTDDHAAWSPDGRSLAFDSNRGGHEGVWLVSSSGGRPRSVAGSRAQIAFLPAFRPLGGPGLPAARAASPRATSDARLVASYLRWVTVIGNDFAGIAKHGPQAAAAVGRDARSALAELGAIRPVSGRGLRFQVKTLAALRSAQATAQNFALGFEDLAAGKRASGMAHLREGFRSGQSFAASAQAASRIAGVLS